MHGPAEADSPVLKADHFHLLGGVVGVEAPALSDVGEELAGEALAGGAQEEAVEVVAVGEVEHQLHFQCNQHVLTARAHLPQILHELVELLGVSVIHFMLFSILLMIFFVTF